MPVPHDAPRPIPSRPARFALLVMLMLEAVLLICLGAAKLLLPDVPLAALDLPVLLVNAVVAAVLLTRMRWWTPAGFRLPVRARDLLSTLPVLVLLVAPTVLMGVDLPPLGKALGLIVVTLLIAFQEEAIFRGVLLHALSPLGTWQAVWGSSLLFGVIHLNSLLVGRDVAFVAVQVVASVLGGVGLAALRMRVGSIWPLIALHAMNDFVQFSAAGDTTVAQAAPTLLAAKLGVASLMALYGVVLLKGTARRMRAVGVPS